MLPRRHGAARAAAEASAGSTWGASPPSAAQPTPSYAASSGFASSSPSIDSDHTSDDTGDHFDFDDSKLAALVARKDDDDDGAFFGVGDGPLPATVEKVISAVYEEITREENAERAGGGDGGLWSDLQLLEYAADDDDDDDSKDNVVVQSSAFGSGRRGGSAAAGGAAAHRHSSANSSSSSVSGDDLAKQDPGASKRARRSEIEKKSRQRRQGLLRRMRDDVHRLEAIYADLLEKKKSGADENDALYVRPAATARRSRATTDVKQMVSRLTELARTLTDEQSHIRRLLQEHALFRQAVASSEELEEVLAVADHGIPVSQSFDADFEILSTAECYAIVRECHEAICRFEQSGDFVSTGASFMGWTDRRKFDDVTSALQYGFSKKYAFESAEQLLLKTWDMFRDEAKMAKLSFDTSVRMKFEVLQTVDDDIYIIRRDHQHPGMPYTFLTVHILFRLQTPEGFTLCFRSIPAPEIQQSLEPHEIWFDVFHWSHFNHIRDETGRPVGCEVVTGGSIGDPTMLVARHWLFELIISVLRWESSCVSPLFIKFSI